jgi:hypothetical protein
MLQIMRPILSDDRCGAPTAISPYRIAVGACVILVEVLYYYISD